MCVPLSSLAVAEQLQLLFSLCGSTDVHGGTLHAVAVKASASAPAAERQEEVFNEQAEQGPMLFLAGPEALFNRNSG